MRRSNPGVAGDGLRLAMEPELKEIVLGLHWDPPPEGATAHPDNLDAVCLLLGGAQQVIDIIHPGHPRNADGSVVHTGDSRTGASAWDDERIFVFLEALPPVVSTVAFIVSSASGRPFSEISGASCHVSDHATEYKWIDMKLTALGKQSAHCIATLRRGPAGWEISRNGHLLEGNHLAELLSVAKSGKSRGS